MDFASSKAVAGVLIPKTSAPQGKVYVDTGCLVRANSGHSPTAVERSNWHEAVYRIGL